MSKVPNKKRLNNCVKKAGAEGEGFPPGRCPVGKQRGAGRQPATAGSKWSNKGKKIVILCYFQAKEGPNIGYRKRMYQYWKNYRLFEMEKQDLACQVRTILKTGKLSKAEIEDLKRQIKTLHVDSVQIFTKQRRRL